ncbi:cyclic nucleotide-binding domain-containing protein [Magnetococcales bacterium HHB-1]
MISLLKRTKLFADISDDHLEHIAKFSERIILEPNLGETIAVLREGDHNIKRHLLVLIAGEFSVGIKDAKRRRGFLISAQKNHNLEDEVIGEISWLLNQGRLTDIEVQERAVLLKINGIQLEAYLDKNPDVGSVIFKRIAYILAKRTSENFWRANWERVFRIRDSSH